MYWLFRSMFPGFVAASTACFPTLPVPREGRLRLSSMLIGYTNLAQVSLRKRKERLTRRAGGDALLNLVERPRPEKTSSIHQVAPAALNS
jgi:hypothetical protein